jgi:ferredoxin
VIHLIYSNKSQEDIIFREEIERLEKQHDNLHVTFTLTRGGPNWSGRAGRIDATLLRERVPYLASLPVFICGPEPMLTTMRELLPAIGVPDAQIHFESFGTARAPDGAVLAEVKTFEVKFSTSRKVAPAPSDVPLLDIAENVGIDLDYECRAGVCGRCKCKLLSGSVIMPTQDALEPEEKARGLILMCQARATEDLTVEA